MDGHIKDINTNTLLQILGGDLHHESSDIRSLENFLETINRLIESHNKNITTLRSITKYCSEMLASKWDESDGDEVWCAGYRVAIKKILGQITKQTIMENNEVPRRNRLDLNTPAELAIYNAIQEVEKVGADVLLTNAITKLSEAKSLVADFIDGVDYIPPKQSTQDLRTEFDEYMMSGMRPFTPDTVFEWFERKIESLQK